MKLSQYLIDNTLLLSQRGVASAHLDARLLIAHALCCDRAALMLQGERELTDAEDAAIEALIARRAAHESVARILGQREFWGLSFGLNEATLEPRPDSETLIETALATMTTSYHEACASQRAFRILDLGTGTGCLLLPLLSEWPEATGIGVDASPRALEQAAQNAAQHDMHKRTSFLQSDWLSAVTGTFDVIISNPPYIKSGEIPSLDKEVKDYDPALALDGGMDGLDPYRLLIPQIPAYLKDGGAVIFEVGQGQAQDVASLLKQAGGTSVSTAKDLGGIERCVYGLYKNAKE